MASEFDEFVECIRELRNKLHIIAEGKGFTDPGAIAISQLL